MLAIETQDLKKAFGEKQAVRGLTLQVPQGEVFGFLGPNGAGKTTSIKMMLDLVRPTAGTVKILGQPANSRSARMCTGFLPEHFHFHNWLNADEFLTLHGELFGIESRLLSRRISELLERVGLLEHRKKQLHTYSKGMLQRVGLAQALINEPALVFLDEPTSGLDPVGRRLVRDIIRELRQKGVTVFLNSHLLSEVEITCDRVAFIKHGEVIRTSDLKSLLELETLVSLRVSALSEPTLAGLKQYGTEIQLDGEVLKITMVSENSIPALVRYLTEQGVDVYAVTPQHISLEDLFIQIVGTDGGL